MFDPHKAQECPPFTIYRFRALRYPIRTHHELLTNRGLSIIIVMKDDVSIPLNMIMVSDVRNTYRLFVDIT